MNKHILDRPVWSSLSTVHASHSVGSQQARRFESDISPFAAARDESAQSLSELAALIPPAGSILVAQANPIICPPDTQAKQIPSAHQMVFEGSKTGIEIRHTIERLNEADAPAMLALATLTKPGPFADRTHLLGEYWGVKQDGQLIAMAGERLRQPGFSEVSGVCTHPDFQGQGLGRDLCVAMVERIFERGETPYLHVFQDNAHAVKLYQMLGFRIRTAINVVQLERI